MVPMSAVIGGVTDAGAPYMNTYYRTKRLPSLSLIIFQGLAKEFRVKK
jgi:hypothetical protein